MKKLLSAAIIGLAFIADAGFAAKMNDVRAVKQVHQQVQQAFEEMESLRKGNHYDADGHDAKAEADLRDAERELSMSMEMASGR